MAVSAAERKADALPEISKTALTPLFFRVAGVDRFGVLKDPVGKSFLEKLKDVPTRRDSVVDAAKFTARAKLIDDEVLEFLREQKSEVAVANLGAGLCTRYYRVCESPRIDATKLTWFELDLPEQIELRRALGETESEGHILVESDMLNKSWRSPVAGVQKPKLFVIEGVLFYFTQTVVKNFFAELAEQFGGAEVVMSATTPEQAQVMNQMKKEGVGSTPNTPFKWGVSSGKEFEEIVPSVRLLRSTDQRDLIRELLTKVGKEDALEDPFYKNAGRVLHLRLAAA